MQRQQVNGYKSPRKALPRLNLACTFLTLVLVIRNHIAKQIGYQPEDIIHYIQYIHYHWDFFFSLF